jgi:hypothetical protein
MGVDMNEITKNDCQWDRSWKERAKDLSDRTWDLIKLCNGGSSFIDNSKPIGRLSDATLELAAHLGQAGSQIDNYASQITSLRSQLNEAREIIAFYGNKKSWTPDGHPQIDADTAPILRDAGERARAFLNKTEGKSDE